MKGKTMKPKRFEKFSHIRAGLDRFAGAVARIFASPAELVRTGSSYPMGRRFEGVLSHA